jgi:hypothetical protein
MANADRTPDRTPDRAPDRRITREPTPMEAEGITGGADSVDKTTYASDVHGSDAVEGQTRPVPVTATVSSGGGFGALGWGALLLAFLAFAAYAMGLFR